MLFFSAQIEPSRRYMTTDHMVKNIVSNISVLEFVTTVMMRWKEKGGAICHIYLFSKFFMVLLA